MPQGVEQWGIVSLLVAGIGALWVKLWATTEAKDKAISEALRILEKNADATNAVASAVEKLSAALPERKRSSKASSTE